jgi:hypothetical protein
MQNNCCRIYIGNWSRVALRIWKNLLREQLTKCYASTRVATRKYSNKTNGFEKAATRDVSCYASYPYFTSNVTHFRCDVRREGALLGVNHWPKFRAFIHARAHPRRRKFFGLLKSYFALPGIWPGLASL